MFNSSYTSQDRDNFASEVVRLRGLVESKDKLITTYHNSNLSLMSKINDVKEFIKSTHELGGFVPDEVLSIAELLDISLTRQYAVEIQVIYRGNIEIPFDAEINDLTDHIEFSFSDRGADDWEVDIFQYDLSIDAEEA